MKLLEILKSHWLIIVIINLAAILRFWRLEELTTFGADQGYDLIKIKEILDGNFTLLGSPIGRFTDTVLYLGPLYYYLQVPFVLITRLDPIGLVIPIIIARLLTTFFVFLIAKKLFNYKVAITAAIISALSPYFVNSLGPSSQPYLIPALVAVIIFLIIDSHGRFGLSLTSLTPRSFRLEEVEDQKVRVFLFGLNKKTFWTLAITGFCAGLMTSLHYLGLSVFLALVFFVFYGLGAQKLRSLIFLLLGFFLTTTPLLIFELRHNFFLSKQLITQLTSGVVSQASQIDGQIVSSVNYLTRNITGFSLPFVIPLILFIIAFAIALKESKDTNKKFIFFLISILIINLVAASLYGQKVQPHYLAASYVPLFIFASFLITIIAKLHRLFPLILITIISIALIKENDLLRSSGYTMPEDLTLVQIRQIAKIIARDAQGEFNITSTLDGDSRALPYRYLVDVYGQKALGVEHYDRGDSLYIITRDPAWTIAKNPLFEISSFQPSTVVKVWEIKGNIRLIKLSKKDQHILEPSKFITIINPVRSRRYWQDPSIQTLVNQREAIEKRELVATWLLQYDTLLDQEIIDLFKNSNSSQEVGAFLEVSEKWATDARVSYKVADGDYYRPDKVFLSGYKPQDRQKLIKTYFKKYKEVFDRTPRSVGAWYIDANSQNLLAKLKVTAAITVADQYDTDSASIWGKYWNAPYYPSKLNSLQPASNQSNKIPIVNLQWAQRDLTLGYGAQIRNSRHSLQANDYINNGFTTDYFKKLFALFLENAGQDFIQVTIGLESGQEALTFFEEFERQLDIIKSYQSASLIKVVSVRDFAAWYHNKYPGISPLHLIKKGNNSWYMSTKFRAAVFNVDQHYILKDLRFFNQQPFGDYLYADKSPYLDRKTTAWVDSIHLGNQIDLGESTEIGIEAHFDRLTLKLDNKEVLIDESGIRADGQVYLAAHKERPAKLKLTVFRALRNTLDKISDKSRILKYSKIEGKPIVGISVNEANLLGFKGYQAGVFNFPFQVMSKFLSPQDLLDKWQPWIN